MIAYSLGLNNIRNDNKSENLEYKRTTKIVDDGSENNEKDKNVDKFKKDDLKCQMNYGGFYDDQIYLVCWRE